MKAGSELGKGGVEKGAQMDGRREPGRRSRPCRLGTRRLSVSAKEYVEEGLRMRRTVHDV